MRILGFDVRELTKADLPEMEVMVRKRRQLGKHDLDEEELEQLIGDLCAGIVAAPHVRYIGAFKNGVMWCFMCIETLPEAKRSWLMSFLCTNPDVVKTWHYRRSGLDSLWIRAFQKAADEQRTFCYWSLPSAWLKTQERTRRTSSRWQFCDIEVVREVPAGTFPEDPFERWMFGRKPKAYDVTIKRAWPILEAKRTYP